MGLKTAKISNHLKLVKIFYCSFVKALLFLLGIFNVHFSEQNACSRLTVYFYPHDKLSSVVFLCVIVVLENKCHFIFVCITLRSLCWQKQHSKFQMWPFIGSNFVFIKCGTFSSIPKDDNTLQLPHFINNIFYPSCIK